MIVSKRKLCILLAASAISISACGKADTAPSKAEDATTLSDSEGTAESADDTESKDADTSLKDIDAVGDIDVEKNLFSVKLTIPAEYAGETTQEELDTVVEEKGYKSAKLQKDGSIKYVMSKKQHKEMMKEIEGSLKSSLEEMIGSEEYPNITDIKPNDNYTNFEITTKSTELSLTESMSTLAFYMYGGMYNIFNGTPADNIHIDFVNSDSGDIISSSDSKDQ